MSTGQAQKVSPTKQGRFGWAAGVGVAIAIVAVGLLVTSSNPREVVSNCVLLLVGVQLTLPGAERSGRAVRVMKMVLLAVAVALIVVRIAVL